MREIPNTAIQIQEGLYQEIIVGRYTVFSKLYSSNGYCFYDKTERFYDEENNLILDEDILSSKRNYAQFCSTPKTKVEDINNQFVSVPIQPNYEIV